jgi:hypothetical protein
VSETIHGISQKTLADQQINVNQWVSKGMRDVGTNGDEEPRILLIHVPKTGGTSLRRMLQEHVSSEETFLSSGKHQWLETTPNELNRFRLFVGHNFLEPIYMLPAKRWITVLAVRDPLSWWRSFYKFRRNEVSTDWRGDGIAKLSFNRWVARQPDVRLSNPQTSWLLTRIRIMFDSSLAPQGVMSSFIGNLHLSGSILVEVLERMIGAITVVGVTEDLFSIYSGVCSEAGWEPAFDESIRSNVSEAPAEDLLLSSKQTARLKALNALDGLLYSWALNRDVRGSH